MAYQEHLNTDTDDIISCDQDSEPSLNLTYMNANLRYPKPT